MPPKKKIEPLPTIEDVWKKKPLSDDQITRIKNHIGQCEFADTSEEEYCGQLLAKTIKIINGLLERAMLLDAYKDMTGDLYATPNINLIPQTIKRLFIFLGPEGEGDKR